MPRKDWCGRHRRVPSPPPTEIRLPSAAFCKSMLCARRWQIFADYQAASCDNTELNNLQESFGSNRYCMRRSKLFAYLYMFLLTALIAGAQTETSSDQKSSPATQSPAVGPASAPAPNPLKQQPKRI